MPKKGVNISAKKAALASTGPASAHGTAGSRAVSQVAPPGKGRYGEAGDGAHLDDDSAYGDDRSVVSEVSDGRSATDEAAGAEVDERSQAELLEEKLKDAIDMTTQKSSAGRTAAFEALCQALSTKYLAEFVAGRRMTIMDCVERGLKKGRGAEQESAAKLVALVCLQLGSIADSDQVYLEQKHTLFTIIADHSASLPARAQCCLTVGLCTFLADSDAGEISQTMNILEAVFSPLDTSLSPEVLRLHSAALSAWTLLVTLLSPRQIYELSQRQVRRLVALLDCSDVDLRIGAGEAIAVIYEGARFFDEDFGFEDATDADADELCDKLRQLATDSNKFRAKKDRKQQRSSFRDVLRAVEENEAPDLRVKFGQELLEVDSWNRKHQYDSFCHMLGSGMNLHLAQNELLRDIFALGAPLLQDQAAGLKNKTSKMERHHMNMAAFKARTVARGKTRDKRAAVF